MGKKIIKPAAYLTLTDRQKKYFLKKSGKITRKRIVLGNNSPLINR